MVRYYKDPEGTQIFSVNDKTSVSQAIGKLEKQDSSDVDVIKQKIKGLEELLNKHKASIINFFSGVLDCPCMYNNIYYYISRFLRTSVKILDDMFFCYFFGMIPRDFWICGVF